MSNPRESEIHGIKLYIRGNEETSLRSNVDVVIKDLHSVSQEPQSRGPNDLHMGTVDLALKCAACQNTKQFCPGHVGSINLKTHIYSPLFAKYIRQFAKVICHNCGRLSITKFPKSKSDRTKLSETVGLNNSSKYKTCPHCNYKNPHIVQDPNNPLGILATFETESEKDSSVSEYTSRIIYAQEMYNIFSRFRDEDIVILGKNDPDATHPKNLCIKIFQVPPNTIRPEIRNFGGGRIRSDDLTNLVQNIVTYNDNLPDNIPDLIPDVPDNSDLILTIENLSLAVYELIKGTKPKDKKRMVGYGKKAQASIASRMPRKYGRIRRNLMGSRARVTARSFITDDNALEIDEVGIPIRVARDIQIKETVRDYNKNRLMIYFKNGLERYPGCSKITKHKTGRTHAINYIPDDFELEHGDVIWRDIIDGDLVQFNRQPSLLPSNISANRARVLHTGDTFRMNVLACPLYNADFDGDAMNLIFVQSCMAMTEIGFLSHVEQRFIRFSTSSPSMGLFQDAIIGIAKLTRNSTKLNKYQAMQMFGAIKLYPKFKKEVYTGRELVSMILPKINFTAKPKSYEPDYAHILKYDPEDIKVVIRRGELISGILDKTSVGQGASGGIFHIIHNEFGPRKALDVMFRLQQLTTAYLMIEGCTIGLQDMVMPKHILETEIHQIIARTIYEANLITDRLDRGAIIPPLGKTLSEFYEELMLNVLQFGDEFIEPVLKYMDLKYNEFYSLVSTGSKGDIGKILGCVSSIGQVTIAGERIKQQFGLKRSMPYFTRFDTSPQSRGYITNSYMSGLTLSEMIFHAMDARYALIQKGLSVSITGEQGRKAIKNLESDVVDNHFRTIKSQNIIQLNYGDTNVDTRYVERVKFPTVMLSDKEFEAYNMKISKFKKVKKSSITETKLKEEFDQLKKDRDFYRTLFLENEVQSGVLFNDKKHMPVNPLRIINNVVSKFNLDKKNTSKLDPLEAIEMVNKFCKELPYTFMNLTKKKNRAEIHERLVLSTYLLQILLRGYLCTYNLENNNIDIKTLKVILEKIGAVFTRAIIAYGTAVGIIAAQSVSEPMTQMVLDSHHRSGGSGSKTTGIDRLKEIFGAKNTSIISTNKKKLPTATMTLIPRGEFAHDKDKATEIANHIEMIPFKTFISSVDIFFEKFGEPTHSKFKHEKSMIQNFVKRNPVLLPPSDLSKWCIRVELIKEAMIFKHMSLETIYHKLREYDGVYVVYNAENSDSIIMRIYRQSTGFNKKGDVNLTVVKTFVDKLLKTIVRGISGIRAAEVLPEQKMQSVVDEDGKIIIKKVYAIFCTGSNIAGILQNKFIDQNTVKSDNIKEIERIYGIEAARYAIINEIRKNIKGLNYSHYTVYADEMTYTGAVTPIERSGLGARELENIMLRASNEAPIEVLADSAINGMTDILTGISAPLTMGRAPKIGSLWNTIAIDQDAVKANTSTVDEYLQNAKMEKM